MVVSTLQLFRLNTADFIDKARCCRALCVFPRSCQVGLGGTEAVTVCQSYLKRLWVVVYIITTVPTET